MDYFEQLYAISKVPMALIKENILNLPIFLCFKGRRSNTQIKSSYLFAGYILLLNLVGVLVGVS